MIEVGRTPSIETELQTLGFNINSIHYDLHKRQNKQEVITLTEALINTNEAIAAQAQIESEHMGEYYDKLNNTITDVTSSINNIPTRLTNLQDTSYILSNRIYYNRQLDNDTEIKFSDIEYDKTVNKLKHKYKDDTDISLDAALTDINVWATADLFFYNGTVESPLVTEINGEYFTTFSQLNFKYNTSGYNYKYYSLTYQVNTTDVTYSIESFTYGVKKIDYKVLTDVSWVFKEPINVNDKLISTTPNKAIKEYYFAKVLGYTATAPDLNSEILSYTQFYTIVNEDAEQENALTGQYEHNKEYGIADIYQYSNFLHKQTSKVSEEYAKTEVSKLVPRKAKPYTIFYKKVTNNFNTSTYTVYGFPWKTVEIKDGPITRTTQVVDYDNPEGITYGVTVDVDNDPWTPIITDTELYNTYGEFRIQYDNDKDNAETITETDEDNNSTEIVIGADIYKPVFTNDFLNIVETGKNITNYYITYNAVKSNIYLSEEELTTYFYAYEIYEDKQVEECTYKWDVKFDDIDSLTGNGTDSIKDVTTLGEIAKFGPVVQLFYNIIYSNTMKEDEYRDYLNETDILLRYDENNVFKRTIAERIADKLDQINNCDTVNNHPKYLNWNYDGELHLKKYDCENVGDDNFDDKPKWSLDAYVTYCVNDAILYDYCNVHETTDKDGNKVIDYYEFSNEDGNVYKSRPTDTLEYVFNYYMKYEYTNKYKISNPNDLHPVWVDTDKKGNNIIQGISINRYPKYYNLLLSKLGKINIDNKLNGAYIPISADNNPIDTDMDGDDSKFAISTDTDTQVTSITDPLSDYIGTGNVAYYSYDQLSKEISDVKTYTLWFDKILFYYPEHYSFRSFYEDNTINNAKNINTLFYPFNDVAATGSGEKGTEDYNPNAGFIKYSEEGANTYLSYETHFFIEQKNTYTVSYYDSNFNEIDDDTIITTIKGKNYIVDYETIKYAKHEYNNNQGIDSHKTTGIEYIFVNKLYVFNNEDTLIDTITLGHIKNNTISRLSSVISESENSSDNIYNTEDTDIYEEKLKNAILTYYDAVNENVLLKIYDVNYIDIQYGGVETYDDTIFTIRNVYIDKRYLIKSGEHYYTVLTNIDAGNIVIQTTSTVLYNVDTDVLTKADENNPEGEGISTLADDEETETIKTIDLANKTFTYTIFNVYNQDTTLDSSNLLTYEEKTIDTTLDSSNLLTYEEKTIKQSKKFFPIRQVEKCAFALESEHISEQIVKEATALPIKYSYYVPYALTNQKEIIKTGNYIYKEAKFAYNLSYTTEYLIPERTNGTEVQYSNVSPDNIISINGKKFAYTSMFNDSMVITNGIETSYNTLEYVTKQQLETELKLHWYHDYEILKNTYGSSYWRLAYNFYDVFKKYYISLGEFLYFNAAATTSENTLVDSNFIIADKVAEYLNTYNINLYYCSMFANMLGDTAEEVTVTENNITSVYMPKESDINFYQLNEKYQQGNISAELPTVGNNYTREKGTFGMRLENNQTIIDYLHDTTDEYCNFTYELDKRIYLVKKYDNIIYDKPFVISYTLNISPKYTAKTVLPLISDTESLQLIYVPNILNYCSEQYMIFNDKYQKINRNNE